MSLVLGEQNIVLLGQFNNNNIIADTFLTESGIQNIIDDEFENEISSGQIVFTSSKYIIKIIETAAVIGINESFHGGNITNDSKINLLAASIVKFKNYEIPGWGYNFNFINFVNSDLGTISRKYFYNSEMKFFPKLITENEFVTGHYISTNFKYSRLNLDIRPQELLNNTTSEKRNAVVFNFNYHINNIYNSALTAAIIESEYESFVDHVKLAYSQIIIE